MAGQATIMNQLLQGKATPQLRNGEYGSVVPNSDNGQDTTQFMRALAESGNTPNSTNAQFDGGQFDLNSPFSQEALALNSGNKTSETSDFAQALIHAERGKTLNLKDQGNLWFSAPEKAAQDVGIHNFSAIQRSGTIYGNDEKQNDSLKELRQRPELQKNNQLSPNETSGHGDFKQGETNISSTRKAEQEFRADQRAKLEKTRQKIRATLVTQGRKSAPSGTLQTLNLHTNTRENEFALSDIPLIGSIARYFQQAQRANDSMNRFYAMRQRDKQKTRGGFEGMGGASKVDMAAELQRHAPHELSMGE